MKHYIGAAAAALVLIAGSSAFAATDGHTATNSASTTATIIRPIAVNESGSLSFGTIVRPSTGTDTVALSASNVRSALSTDAFWLVAPASSVPTFTVQGEGGQAFSLAVDSTVTLTNAGAGGGTLSVTTSNNAGCTTACALSGHLGDVANGALAFQVGGSFPITSTTNTGTYSGTLNVTATYN